MKKHLMTTLLASLLALFTLNNAMAEPMPNPAMLQGPLMYERMPEYQQLTADKKAFVDKTMKESREKMRATGSMLYAKMAMLNAQLMQPSVDKKEIASLMNEINSLHAELLQNRVDTIMKIKTATGLTLPLFPHKAMLQRIHHESKQMMIEKKR